MSPLLTLAVDVAVGIVFTIIVAGMFAQWPHGRDREKDFLFFVRSMLVLLAIAGLGLRGLVRQNDASATYPQTDLVTLAWGGLLVLAYLLPKLQKLTFGKASLDFSTKELQAIDVVNESLDRLAGLMQNWTHSGNTYRELVRKAVPDDALKLLVGFLQDRMGEARKWLSADPNDDVRVALWTWNEEQKHLEFFFSNEITDDSTIGATFSPGEGLLGKAFQEIRNWNETDAQNIPGYKRIAGTQSNYSAVMCMPVTMFLGKSAILGMLTVDKRSETPFSDAEYNIAYALSGLCALALSEYDRPTRTSRRS